MGKIENQEKTSQKKTSHKEHHCHNHNNIECYEITEMPEEEKLYDLAELFKCFGDSTRVRILYVLAIGEIGVGDLADTLQMTQSAISHQLKFLKQAHLVKAKREGKNILYSLADDHVKIILEMGMDHVNE